MVGSLCLRGLLAALPWLTIAFVLVAVAPALADTLEWTDPNGGDFNDPNNWLVTSGAGPPPPGIGDIVNFNDPNTYTVTFTQNETSADLRVLDGVVTFLSDSATLREYTFSTGAADVNVSGGTLNIGSASNPVFVNVGDIMNIGFNVGSGTVTVSGAESRLDAVAAKTHNIGSNNNDGTLQLLNGATANYGTTGGTLNVGSTSGGATVGTVSVSGGSSLSTGNILLATVDSGATATMTVTDPNSSISQPLAGATLTVGSATTGTGILNVQTGGTFTSGTGSIILDTTGTIDIQGGTFNANGLLTMSAGSALTLNGGALNAAAGVDNSAVGTLIFLDGTLTVSGGAFVPNAGGPTDDFTIDGPSTSELPKLVVSDSATMNVGKYLFVANAKRGELSITGGGTVFVDNGTIIADDSDSTGITTVDGAGSSLTVTTGGITVGDSGDGTLNIRNGGMVSSGLSIIAEGGSSISSVTVDGTGSTWTNTSALIVSYDGDAVLNIINGGSVINTSSEVGGFFGASGAVTVDGDGSTWTNSAELAVSRYDGIGTLDITSGGVVTNTDGIVGAFMGSNGTVTVDGADSVWNNFTSLTVGDGGNGTLIIQNGGAVSNTTGVVGDNAGSTGAVTVDGVNSIWASSSSLKVGAEGNGTLDILNGGAVSGSSITIGGGPNSTGMVNVDGAGSSLENTSGNMTIGDGGNGTLNTQNGATVSATNSIVYIGFANSTGIATVDGAGSTWTNSTVIVGFENDSDGTLNILNGGVVSCNQGFIAVLGSRSTGAVIISGAGSRWTTATNMTIGQGATPEITSADMLLADQGLLDVEGTLDVWETGTLTIDGGTLKVDSAAVTVEGIINYLGGAFHLTDAGGYTLGANSGPIDQLIGGGAAFVRDGGLIVDKTLTLPAGTSLTAIDSVVTSDATDNNGLINANNATITTAAGMTNNADMILVNTTVEGSVDNTVGSTVTVLGTVDFNGLVSGTGNFFGPGTANFNGGMAMGASPAEVSFEGSVVLGSTNKLFVDLAGLAAGSEYDVLTIAGDATLAGDLSVVLDPNFSLTPGNWFSILDVAGTSSGEFSGLADGALVGNYGGVPLFIDYNAGVTLLAGLPGDFDFDFDVDGLDFLIWQTDPSVGLLSDWETNYGKVITPPLVAAVATVPEPSALALVSLRVLLFLRRRRGATTVVASR